MSCYGKRWAGFIVVLFSYMIQSCKLAAATCPYRSCRLPRRHSVQYTYTSEVTAECPSSIRCMDTPYARDTHHPRAPEQRCAVLPNRLQVYGGGPAAKGTGTAAGNGAGPRRACVGNPQALSGGARLPLA